MENDSVKIENGSAPGPAWSKILIGLVVLIVLGYGSFSLIRSRIPVDPHYLVDDDMPGWQTYKNDEYGFEIKSFDSWHLEDTCPFSDDCSIFNSSNKNDYQLVVYRNKSYVRSTEKPCRICSNSVAPPDIINGIVWQSEVYCLDKEDCEFGYTTYFTEHNGNLFAFRTYTDVLENFKFTK